MKTIFLITLLLASSAHAGVNFITQLTGIQEDKQIHFAVGYISSDFFATKAEKMGASIWESRAIGLGSALCLATAKEGVDSLTPKNKWDWQDWTATVLGSVVNISIHF